ncbi:MAG TPA: pilus assembly protein TadG-related protein [Lacipirellula sp.]
MSAIGSLIERMRSGLGRLRRDTRGMVLVYISIALAVFMGGAALVIDGGRIFTLQTELQSAADAFALAGAAELDGLSDSITRANRAIDTLVQNEQSFASGAADVTVVKPIRFFDSLPDDGAAITADFETTDPAAARYVEVVVQTRSIDNFFAQLIGGGNTTATTARAVAGFTQAVCQFTPLFICNPFEGTGISIEEAVSDPDIRRRLIEMKSVGPNNAYFPGNFGLLESPEGRGGERVKESLAKATPNQCFIADGVKLKTGQVNSTKMAINTRFDMYQGSFGKNNEDYRPALNTIKGYLPKQPGNVVCQPEIDETGAKAEALPRDECFSSGNCLMANGRMGNGVWDLTEYWEVNHPGETMPAELASSTVSRYDVYRWEINNSRIPNNSASGGENGNMRQAPRCYNGSTLSDEPDRRIIYAAVLNCQELQAADPDGKIAGASDGPQPVEAFVKMFITEPVEKEAGDTGGGREDDVSTSQFTLWAELVNVVRPGDDDGVLRDIVQLYR